MKINFRPSIVVVAIQISIQVLISLSSAISNASVCEALFAPASQKVVDGEYSGDNGWKFIRVKVVRNAHDASIESVEIGNVKNTSPVLSNAFQFVSKTAPTEFRTSSSGAIKTDRIEVVPGIDFGSGVGPVVVQAGGFRFRIEPSGRDEVHLTITVISAGMDLPDAYLRRKI